MYAGHFAAALALKSARPETPTWALVAGSGALDLVFGVLVAAGVEGFAPDFASSHRLVVPWSHSLAGAVLIGTAFAACFWRRGAVVVLVLFAAVLSHLALDVLVHRPDISLWPSAGRMFGFYDRFGPVSGWAESAFIVVCTGVYALRARRAETFGRYWLANCALMGVFWAMGLASG